MSSPGTDSGQLRPLLPATSQPREQPTSPIRTKRKRVSACHQCRMQKSKCDAQVPQCAACVLRGSECRYIETEKRQATQQARQCEALLSLLKTLPRVDAITLLRRFREGSDPEAIMDNERRRKCAIANVLS
ncbi:hypothetical protein M3J09_000277 [Ascochyta lentis]